MSIESAQRKIYQDFTGGLNTRLSTVELPENEMSVLDNYVINNRGLLEKANGYVKDHSPFPNSPDSFIRMLLNLRRGTNTDVLLMAAQDDANTNALYKVDFKKTTGDGTSHYIGYTVGTASFVSGNTSVTGSGTLWLSNLKPGDKIKRNADPDSAYTEIANVNTNTSITLVAGGYLGTTGAGSAYTARVIWAFTFIPRGVVFNSKAILTNGSETPMSYDNATLALITDPDAPKARYIAAHKNRVFMANTSSFPSRLFWSHVNDETLWEPDSEEDIFPQDNGAIVSITSFADSLIVFKNSGSTNSIYQVVGAFDQDVVGTPDFIRRVDGTENIGIIAERSPVVHNGTLYFIAQTGLYAIDQRMGVRKVTYDVDTLLRDFNFTVAPQTSKTYTFDTTTQWNSGTLSGVKVTSDGTMGNFFDLYNITNALQRRGCASVQIDTNNDVHVAYVDNANNKIIRYKKWLALDSSIAIDEAAFTAAANVDSLSMDVAPNGNIGVVYRYSNTSGGVEIHLIERVASIWSDSVVANGFGVGSFNVEQWGLSLRYNISSEPRVASSQRSTGVSPTAVGLLFSKRSGVTWTSTGIDNNDPYYGISLYLDTGTDNPAISAYRYGTAQPKSIACYKSVNTGSSFTLVDNHTFTSPTWKTDGIQLTVNTAGNFISGFEDFDGSIATRNHTTTTTNTVDSSVNTPKFGGYVNLTSYAPDLDYFHYNVDGGIEKYLFETIHAIQDGFNVTNLATFCGDRAFANNDVVFASIAYSTNANTIIMRRLSFRAIWTGPEENDSTLSAWGIYSVMGETDNQATVTHEIALNTITPATVFNTIVPGAIISSDPTQIFIKNRITMVLVIFAAPTIGAIIDNYTGAGVDARQIVGTSFLNELYYSGSQSNQPANNTTIILDKFGSFIQIDYPVSAFEYFKNKLYAGLSTRGDLLILQQGFDFDGVAYTSDAQFKEDFLGSIELEKDLYKIYVLCETKNSGSIIFSYRLDSFKTIGGSTWKDTTLDQTQDGFFEIPIGQKARSIQCRIRNTDLDAKMGILSFVVVYENLHLR